MKRIFAEEAKAKLRDGIMPSLKQLRIVCYAQSMEAFMTGIGEMINSDGSRFKSPRSKEN